MIQTWGGLWRSLVTVWGKLQRGAGCFLSSPELWICLQMETPKCFGHPILLCSHSYCPFLFPCICLVLPRGDCVSENPGLSPLQCWKMLPPLRAAESPQFSRLTDPASSVPTTFQPLRNLRGPLLDFLYLIKPFCLPIVNFMRSLFFHEQDEDVTTASVLVPSCNWLWDRLRKFNHCPSSLLLLFS